MESHHNACEVKDEHRSEIYFAGGCFWGVEKYFQNISGVIATDVGYANGKIENPTYEQVCRGDTGFAEAVHVVYDPVQAPLRFLLEQFYKVIDPTSLNRQGNDRGSQYRTGVYYTADADRGIIEESLKELSYSYSRPIAVECSPIRCYYKAEDYHQRYLKHNPAGYCHISSKRFEEAKYARPDIFQKPEDEALKRMLTPEQYAVTQLGITERPFINKYWDHYEPGIYVDVTTGEPLFISDDKFHSGCGWPSFSKPVDQASVKELKDSTHGMQRTEVRSKFGDSHLGHVFDDGPKALGGRRYCINSAALRFIPKKDMETEGYGRYLLLIK